MTSERIRTLLLPPSNEQAESEALLYLNSKFATLDDFLNTGDHVFDELESKHNLLQREVPLVVFSIAILV